MDFFQLADDFMVKYAERRLRPSTVRGYRINLYNHFLPIVACEKPLQLDADFLDLVTEQLHEKGLSNRSIVYVLATVRKMMNFGIRRGYVTANPFTQFDMPRVNRYQYRVLTEADVHLMADLVKGSSLEVPVTMALFYGLRRGECLGIVPGIDVDPSRNVLHVQRTRAVEDGKEVITPCKTQDSNRFVLLRPEHTQLLCSKNGRFACELTPMQLEYRFKKLLSDCNFPIIRFHDLRHTFATLMLAKGVNPKIVSSVLGHSGVDVTLDIYSHPDVSMQSVCLDALK